MTQYARYAAARARGALRRFPPGEWVDELNVGPMAERKVIRLGIDVLVRLGQVEEDLSGKRVQVRLARGHHPDETAPAAAGCQLAMGVE